MCVNCCRRMHKEKEGIGNRDRETYLCLYCSNENDDAVGGESIGVYAVALIWVSNTY